MYAFAPVLRNAAYSSRKGLFGQSEFSDLGSYLSRIETVWAAFNANRNPSTAAAVQAEFAAISSEVQSLFADATAALDTAQRRYKELADLVELVSMREFQDEIDDYLY